jgi:hypothetical protein
MSSAGHIVSVCSIQTNKKVQETLNMDVVRARCCNIDSLFVPSRRTEPDYGLCSNSVSEFEFSLNFKYIAGALEQKE